MDSRLYPTGQVTTPAETSDLAATGVVHHADEHALSLQDPARSSRGRGDPVDAECFSSPADFVKGFRSSRTAGDPWCGRSGSLAPSGWTASRPAPVLCPGRWRGTAGCPG